jgi:hypothetical protein
MNISALYKQRADLRAFLEIILSIATVIVFMVFALKPTALTIISLYSQIQEKTKTAADLNQKLSDLQNANTNYGSNQNAIPHIDTAIANAPKPDFVVEQIQAVSAKDSVSLLGISIGEVLLAGTAPKNSSPSDLAPLPDGAHEMPISISVRGTYPGLSLFIKDLENLRTIINLDTVSISSAQSEQGDLTVAIISGRVPYLGK